MDPTADTLTQGWEEATIGGKSRGTKNQKLVPTLISRGDLFRLRRLGCRVVVVSHCAPCFAEVAGISYALFFSFKIV